MPGFNTRVRPFRVLMCALAVLFAIASVQAEDTGGEVSAKGGKTVRLFTIGNSFSGNATRHLVQLANAGGHELILGKASIGGASLARHWKQVEAAQADPDGEGGRYSTGQTLQEMLTAEAWDYVTVQQFSWLSHDYETYQPYADNLAEYVREHAPEAELLVHQTWAYRVDDPRFTGEQWKPGHPKTQAEMYQRVTEAYEKLAEHLDARLIPVGDALYRADTDPRWGYRPDESFDFANAEQPALPDQTHSLHAGWRWRADPQGQQVLRIDGHHASPAGEYLAGCVFYEMIFGESVVGNTFILEGMDPAYARFLQQTAHEAVAARQAAPAMP